MANWIVGLRHRPHTTEAASQKHQPSEVDWSMASIARSATGLASDPQIATSLHRRFEVPLDAINGDRPLRHQTVARRHPITRHCSHCPLPCSLAATTPSSPLTT